MESATLGEVLLARACDSPDQVALTFLADGERDERTLTYAQLEARARDVAAALDSNGIRPGDRALLMYPPGLDYVVAFFGCMYASVIAVPAYPPQVGRMQRMLPRLNAIAGSAGPAAGLTTSALLPFTPDMTVQCGHLADVLWLATDTLPRATGQCRSPDMVEPSQPAFLQYTSGSTGTPRGAIVSHANILANLAAMALSMKPTPDSRAVVWLPPYHDLGLIGGILEPIYAGFPSVLMSPVSVLQRPVRWLQAISRFRATISGGPNSAYEMCVRAIPLEQRRELDLRSWSVACNGAEPIHSDTLDRFANAFSPYGFRREAFFPCYGLAEATLAVTCGVPGRVLNAQDRAGKAVVSCGRPFSPDIEVAVIDPERFVRCADGVTGEVWVAGPSVTRGYWGDASATAAIFGAHIEDEAGGPYLRTGDLGFLQDGELFITGRIKDLIITGGQNRYPHDIERTVSESHPALQPGACAAFGLEVRGREEVVVVQELRRTGRQAALDDVLLAARQALSEQHDLGSAELLFVLPGTVPKTTSGKVQRTVCREQYLAGTLAQRRWPSWQ
jgi:acyl-CoA synthetase (AMP-forming)/AMP-acid ligase II